MRAEQLNEHFMAKRLTEFMQAGPQLGVNNFIISGPVVDEPMVFHSFAGIFPPGTISSRNHGILMISGDGEVIGRGYLQILRDLKLPPRVVNLKIAEDRKIRSKIEAKQRLEFRPIITVNFGKVQRTSEDVIVLCMILGITPQQALNEVAQYASRGLADKSR